MKRESKAKNWLPIETAPKDRRIRVWSPDQQTARSTLTYGTEHHARWDDDRYSLRPKPFWNIDAYRNRTSMSRAYQPTHWQEIGPGPHEE